MTFRADLVAACVPMGMPGSAHRPRSGPDPRPPPPLDPPLAAIPPSPIVAPPPSLPPSVLQAASLRPNGTAKYP